ncbi:hypothetical protein C8J57DRAFT_1529976 [Mycena rebaudengoi]|nr:hypothetical protein C8J57DRAFT_1529976 [Mycena rebaudengoi]
MSDVQNEYPATYPYSNGTFITTANVNLYGPKRRREDSDGKSFYLSIFEQSRQQLTRFHRVDELFSTQRKGKRRRQKEDAVEIIPSEDIKLISEIGSGPGYFLHVGRNEGRAIIVRVFNRSPTVRQRLESTVALSKGFMSIALGLKMIAGLSAGMNHLCVQGVSLGSMGVENFDVFLDVFLLSINPRMSEESDPVESQEPQEDKSWHVFNALCQKTTTSAEHYVGLISANRVMHHEEISRKPRTPRFITPQFRIDKGDVSVISVGTVATHPSEI